MACQTGIRADDELLNFFDACKQCKVRFGKIVINKERLCVNYHTTPSKDWRADWQKCLPDAIDSYEPCFLLFRFESSHDWILISFADDKASVRDKMLLAATKATFKSEFGQNFIRAEYQVATRADLVLENFEKRYLNTNAASTTFPVSPASGAVLDDSKPYTHIERELSTVARGGICLPVQNSHTMRGVQFPIDQDALRLLKAFAKGDIDFIQLSVDTLNEAIKLEDHAEKLSIGELSNKIPKKKPKYSLYRFREIESQPVFFIYSVPPSASCTIKELMLFSSCKAPLVSEIQSECGVKITKKIEVDSRERLDASALANYVSVEPPNDAVKAPIQRPPRPGGGPRRITQVAE